MATATSLATLPPIQDDWQTIFDPAMRIVIDRTTLMLTPAQAQALLGAAPFGHSISGEPDQLLAQLPAMPSALADGIIVLAGRFADLMSCGTVRLRFEGIIGNACRKVHADYTDLRLICTLAGPGTDYTLGDDPDGPLMRIPTGAAALFKGREFGSGHAACLHRSPPIDGTGGKRLVLVIDTPAKPHLTPHGIEA